MEVVYLFRQGLKSVITVTVRTAYMWPGHMWLGSTKWPWELLITCWLADLTSDNWHFFRHHPFNHLWPQWPPSPWPWSLYTSLIMNTQVESDVCDFRVHTWMGVVVVWYSFSPEPVMLSRLTWHQLGAVVQGSYLSFVMIPTFHLAKLAPANWHLLYFSSEH